jgi:hypothetical protein
LGEPSDYIPSSCRYKRKEYLDSCPWEKNQQKAKMSVLGKENDWVFPFTWEDSKANNTVKNLTWNLVAPIHSVEHSSRKKMANPDE